MLLSSLLICGDTLGRMKRVALIASSNHRPKRLGELSSGKTPVIILSGGAAFLTVHCKMLCLMFCFGSRGRTE